TAATGEARSTGAGASPAARSARVFPARGRLAGRGRLDRGRRRLHLGHSRSPARLDDRRKFDPGRQPRLGRDGRDGDEQGQDEQAQRAGRTHGRVPRGSSGENTGYRAGPNAGSAVRPGGRLDVGRTRNLARLAKNPGRGIVGVDPRGRTPRPPRPRALRTEPATMRLPARLAPIAVVTILSPLAAQGPPVRPLPPAGPGSDGLGTLIHDLGYEPRPLSP